MLQNSAIVRDFRIVRLEIVTTTETGTLTTRYSKNNNSNILIRIQQTHTLCLHTGSHRAHKQAFGTNANAHTHWHNNIKN